MIGAVEKRALDSIRHHIPVGKSHPNGIRTRVAGMKTRCPDLTRRWGLKDWDWAAQGSNL